jgi:hypothetical protein
MLAYASTEKPLMKSTGAAITALSLIFAGLIFAGSATIDRAMAQTPQMRRATPVREATDAGPRHRTRHVQRYADRGYDPPVYDDRPVYYRPYPYVVPVPFFLGLGFGPWW